MVLGLSRFDVLVGRSRRNPFRLRHLQTIRTGI
jgi:hypothetical protein